MIVQSARLPARQNALGFLRRDHLAAFVHAGLQVDVVRALQFAGFLVFDVGIGTQGVVRTAHVAPRGGYFAFRNGHGRLSQAQKLKRRPQSGHHVSAGLCLKGCVVSRVLLQQLLWRYPSPRHPKQGCHQIVINTIECDCRPA